MKLGNEDRAAREHSGRLRGRSDNRIRLTPGELGFRPRA